MPWLTRFHFMLLCHQQKSSKISLSAVFVFLDKGRAIISPQSRFKVACYYSLFLWVSSYDNLLIISTFLSLASRSLDCWRIFCQRLLIVQLRIPQRCRERN